MKHKRFTAQKLIGILKEAGAGVLVKDLYRAPREHGLSGAAFYGWRSRFAGLQLSKATRLKVLRVVSVANCHSSIMRVGSSPLS